LGSSGKGMGARKTKLKWVRGEIPGGLESTGVRNTSRRENSKSVHTLTL